MDEFFNEKKIYYLTDDETVEEEIVSEGELSHKKPKKTVASPTSSLSPTNPYLQSSSNNQDTVMISQNGSTSNSTNTSVTQSAITEPPLSGNNYNYYSHKIYLI
jgi:hypothetical protein